MTDLSELDRRIEEKLAGQKERTLFYHNHFMERMQEDEERNRHYTALADRLVGDFIRPRLERLARRFDNAVLLGADQSGRHQCVCSFQHTPRFPATARLELAVSRDGEFKTLFLLYNLTIHPVFIRLEGQDRFALPLDGVEEEKVAAWVEEKILRFLDTYLQLETVEQYQAENLVTDPVCGMRINRLYAAGQAEFQGKTYYFCIPECREKFIAGAQKYLGGG